MLDTPLSWQTPHVSDLSIRMSAVSPTSIMEGLLSIRRAPTALQKTDLTHSDQ